MKCAGKKAKETQMKAKIKCCGSSDEQRICLKLAKIMTFTKLMLIFAHAKNKQRLNQNQNKLDHCTEIREYAPASDVIKT